MTVPSSVLRAAALLASVALATSAAAQATARRPDPPASLTKEQLAAKEIYKQLVEINTTAEHGSTTKAAEAVAARFRAAGFPEADIFQGGAAPTKGNIVVRYHGTGQRKPLLLLAHLDVVEAKREDWTRDPFQFGEEDGFFYGRGSADDKPMAAIFTAMLLRWKAEGYKPDRDVILALTADEEGGPDNGVRWLIQNHKDKIDAAYALNEGGGGSYKNWKPLLHAVQATEKVPVNFALKVTNKGGHSSVPVRDNAIYHLAQGLARLADYTFPVALNEVTKVFFERTAALETPEMAAAMRAIVKNPGDAQAAATISKQPRYSSMLRTTCVATRLFGGHADNALPQLATANVNCRIVPNVPPEQVRQELLRVMGDTAITIAAAPPPAPSAPSPLTPELMEPVEALTKQMWPGTPVIPQMSTGATDGRFLREVGIPTYGVSGIFGDMDDNRAHGRDERTLIKSFFEGNEFLSKLVKALTSKKPIT
ncbi:MAG: M20/M25/M40 family metallo-hydrolase [Gemmatimonadetes bacterium]|nr:M20/M25/M40 family metallo-hydrolase [Gemmatimonadota bacterium]